MRKQYKCPLEVVEQKVVCEYIALRPKLDRLFFHVPNERSNAVERMRLSSLGVKPGVPDNWIMQPFKRGNKTYYGLVFELKRQHPSVSRVSPEQKKWVADLSASGFHAVVVYGSGEAIDLIKWAYGP